MPETMRLQLPDKFPYKRLSGFALACLVALGLVSAMAARAESEGDRSVLDRSDLGFRLTYPSGWIPHEFGPPPVPVKFDLPVLHYDRLEVQGRMEVRIMLLDNTDGRTPDAFLTSGDVHGEPFVPREQAVVNGVPSVQFGEQFDPPAYGLIAARLQMMTAIASNRILHVDMVVLPVVDRVEAQLIAFDLWQSITPVGALR